MSLPSYVNFYDKNDVFLGNNFINCGWVYDEESVLKSINIISENFPEWNRAVAYGEEYFKDTLELTFWHVAALRINHRKDREKRFNANPLEKIHIPVMARNAKGLISEDIVGVQPMKESTGKVFTLKAQSITIDKEVEFKGRDED